jgi:hypothetical protein
MHAQSNGDKSMVGLGLWCLMPLSTIFQLYHGNQLKIYESSIKTFTSLKGIWDLGARGRLFKKLIILS